MAKTENRQRPFANIDRDDSYRFRPAEPIQVTEAARQAPTNRPGTAE